SENGETGLGRLGLILVGTDRAVAKERDLDAVLLEYGRLESCLRVTAKAADGQSERFEALSTGQGGGHSPVHELAIGKGADVEASLEQRGQLARVVGRSEGAVVVTPGAVVVAHRSAATRLGVECIAVEEGEVSLAKNWGYASE